MAELNERFDRVELAQRVEKAGWLCYAIETIARTKDPSPELIKALAAMAGDELDKLTVASPAGPTLKVAA